MISKITALTLLINIALTFALPLGLVIYLFRKNTNSRAPMYIGAYSFVVFNALLSKYVTPIILSAIGIGLNNNITPVFSGILDSAFITFGIYLSYKWLLEGKTGFYSGVTFGIGYSSTMLVLLGGYKAFDTLLTVLFSSFGKNIDIEKTEIANRLKDIAATPPVDFFWTGIIAFLFAFLEIAFALAILYGIKNKKFSFITYVFAARGLFLIAQIFISKLGFVASFVFALLIAVASSIAIVKSEKLFFDNPPKKTKKK